MDYRRLFEDNLGLIEQVIGFVCRRRGFGADETEDFSSYAHLKLIDRDYAVLRKFQGKSRLKTYLVTVTLRLALDYRTEKWGKWRPSAKAQRLGSSAVRLERLIHRDGHSRGEAVEILQADSRVTDNKEALEDLAGKLPERSVRRFEGDEQLASFPDPDPGPDRALEKGERSRVLAVTEEKLIRVLESLDTEERMIIRMRYDENLKVSTIARVLGLNQKALYRRFNKLLGGLRKKLEDCGVTTTEVQALFDDGKS